jgi:hypothetical protein
MVEESHRSSSGVSAVLPIVISMVVILVIAGLVVAYVAFPHRGEEIPAAPWLGDMMRRGVDAAPTLDHTEGHEDAHRDEDADRPLWT